jgi:hypothetical protein
MIAYLIESPACADELLNYIYVQREREYEPYIVNQRVPTHKNNAGELNLETVVEQGKWCVYLPVQQGATKRNSHSIQ